MPSTPCACCARPGAAEASAELAEDIAAEDGLIWKVWTEDPQAFVAGGVYLFADEHSATRYIDKHTQRLGSFGVTDAEFTVLKVNGALSRTDHAVLERS
ncbi:YdhR family protein [Kocuria palustris]|uniref:YdhR family protein n=1 Tax=Kocuria palustris TaxID=71999 RepID=UPI003450584A